MVLCTYGIVYMLCKWRCVCAVLCTCCMCGVGTCGFVYMIVHLMLCTCCKCRIVYMSYMLCYVSVVLCYVHFVVIVS